MLTRRCTIAAFGVLALLSTDAVAGFVDGSDLLAMCSTPKIDPVYRLKVAECRGYVVGIADTFDCKRQSSGFTWNSAAPGTQRELVDAVINWLRAHPDTLPRQANGLVAAALSEAHPCADTSVTSNVSPASP